MKKPETFLREYVNRLSVDNLKYLQSRFSSRVGGELAEAINVLSTTQDIDKWLLSAKSHEEFYNMIDLVQEYVERELNKRSPELVERW